MYEVQPGDNLTKRFLRFASLNIIANISIPLSGLIDAGMLGNLSEIKFLAGVSLSSVLFDYIYWTFGFLRMATTGTTAQAIGQRDAEESYLTLYRPLVLAVGLAGAVLVLQSPLRDFGLWLLTGAPEVKEAAVQYYDWRIWGAPAVLSNFVLIGWFLGREESKHALFMTVTANLSNVGFNYLFIIHLNMAAAGAGIATMLSQYCMLLVGVGLYLRHRPEVAISLRAVWRMSTLRALGKLNLDIMVRTVCLIFTFSLFTNYSSALGVTVLAGNSILRDIMVFAAYIIDGSAFATESLAGTIFGEGDRLRLRKLHNLAHGTALGFSLGFALLLLATHWFVLPLFTENAAVIIHLHRYWWWLIPILLVGAFAFTYDGFFLGLTRGSTLRNSMLLSTFIVFLPIAWYGAQIQNNDLLWSSLLAFMAARGATLFWASRAVLRDA